MRLDGVRDGKPASAAGLQKGDIIIKLDDIPVDDIQMYMKALANFKQGQTIKVSFIRDHQTNEVKVTFCN